MTKIAILGFGTVGSGVAEVLAANGPAIGRRVNGGVEVKYILDLQPCEDARWAGRFVSDFGVIEADPEVAVVVETIGGCGAALDYTRRALRAGKSVVTSNKEVVAEHGVELLELAREQGVRYLFEASVGGGIPILHPLVQCLGANELSQVTGILNGTTNYILTRMIRAGLSFDAALKEAQEKGYAERDPSADVEGTDACRKICILAAIAFGRHVSPAQVPTVGIAGVTGEDVACAGALGCKVKLLARAVKGADGRVCAFVEPHFVPVEHPLAGVEDVFNAIQVTGDAIGDVMFYGRGAGKLPTASAVVSDVMEVVREGDRVPALAWAEGGAEAVAPLDGWASPWGVRLRGAVPELVGAEAVDWPDAPEGWVALRLEKRTRVQLEAELGGVGDYAAYRILDGAGIN